MAGVTIGAALRQIHRMFDEAGVASLGDAQLLDRFVRDGDESAFEALVDRHGPMVLGTARAVLKDSHAAEDAFQSAFIALARKAPTIRGADALGGWLHRVAYREAVRAGVEATRRRASERAAAASRRAPEPGVDDLRAIVHAEVERLPESYRLPVVLCDLEGLTKGQAAHHLGWTEATVRGRLERARALLRDRLARRGLGVTAGGLAAAMALEARAAEVGVGAARVAAAVRAATAAAGVGKAAGVAATALALAGRFKAAGAAAAVALGGLAAALALAGPGATATPAGPGVETVEGPPPTPARPAKGELVEVSGRVVAPDGAAVAGATVRPQPRMDARPGAAGPMATTAADGRFALRAPRHAFEESAGRGLRVVASARGFGMGRADAGGPGEGVTVRLAPDDVPIEGRVVDLEGRPVAGASIRVAEVWTPTAADLTRWAGEVGRFGGQGPWNAYHRGSLDWLADGPGSAAIAAADGRFRVEGVGRERLAGLIIAGPGIETAKVYATTRLGGPIRTTAYRMPLAPTLYHPARFDHAAAPGRPVEGVVTDRETGRPIAGVTIQGKVRDDEISIAAPDVEATTDAEGRYRLLGLARGARLSVVARPTGELPYPTAEFEVPGGADAASTARLELALRRGVLVRGRLTEKGDGRPVAGARINTYTFADDPVLADYPGYAEGETPSTWTDADGRFAVVALPGRGLLAANVPANRHLVSPGAEAIAGHSARLRAFATKPRYCHARDNHAIAEIRPAPGAGAIERDLEVDPGRAVAGTIVDPEGRPLEGTTSTNLAPSGWPRPTSRESSRFEAVGLDPAHPRHAVFYHDGRKLAAAVRLRGDETGPVTVRLRPWGTLTGRAVDADGQPLAGVVLIRNLPNFDAPVAGRVESPLNEHQTLGPDGRFRVERLVPGSFCKLHIMMMRGELLGSVPEPLPIGAGEVKDVGDIRLRADPE